jgi:hypothetical protein
MNADLRWEVAGDDTHGGVAHRRHAREGNAAAGVERARGPHRLARTRQVPRCEPQYVQEGQLRLVPHARAAPRRPDALAGLGTGAVRRQRQRDDADEDVGEECNPQAVAVLDLPPRKEEQECG